MKTLFIALAALAAILVPGGTILVPLALVAVKKRAERPHEDLCHENDFTLDALRRTVG